jgi:hypothetical protein
MAYVINWLSMLLSWPACYLGLQVFFRVPTLSSGCACNALTACAIPWSVCYSPTVYDILWLSVLQSGSACHPLLACLIIWICLLSYVCLRHDLDGILSECLQYKLSSGSEYYFLIVHVIIWVCRLSSYFLSYLLELYATAYFILWACMPFYDFLRYLLGLHIILWTTMLSSGSECYALTASVILWSVLSSDSNSIWLQVLPSGSTYMLYSDCTHYPLGRHVILCLPTFLWGLHEIIW